VYTEREFLDGAADEYLDLGGAPPLAAGGRSALVAGLHSERGSPESGRGVPVQPTRPAAGVRRLLGLATGAVLAGAVGGVAALNSPRAARSPGGRPATGASRAGADSRAVEGTKAETPRMAAAPPARVRAESASRHARGTSHHAPAALAGKGTRLSHPELAADDRAPSASRPDLGGERAEAHIESVGPATVVLTRSSGSPPATSRAGHAEFGFER
jgi:hypothetical protein